MAQSDGNKESLTEWPPLHVKDMGELRPSAGDAEQKDLQILRETMFVDGGK